MPDLKSLIRSVPGFPKEGIVFRDITTLLSNHEGFTQAIEEMIAPFKDMKIDKVVGAESRGFIFGAPIALNIGAAFIPVRKPGKLPANTISETYELEYGADTIEIHKDAINSGDKVLLVDDLLATGGTMAACTRLVEKLGGDIIGISFLIDLTFLGGRAKLDGYRIESVIEYDSE